MEIPTHCMALGCTNPLKLRRGQRGRVQRYCTPACYAREWKAGRVVPLRLHAQARSGNLAMPSEPPTRCMKEGCHNLLAPPGPGRRCKRFCCFECYQQAWAASRKLPPDEAPADDLGSEVPLDGVPEAKRLKEYLRKAQKALNEGVELEDVLERFGHLGVKPHHLKGRSPPAVRKAVAASAA